MAQIFLNNGFEMLSSIKKRFLFYLIFIIF